MRFFSVLILSFSLLCTGCGEIFFGIGCGVGIIFSSDQQLEVTELPPAVAGQYYEHSLTPLDGHYYMHWLPQVTSQELPTGLELVNEFRPYENASPESGDYPESQDVQEVWVLRGIPQTSGEFSFNFIGYTYRSMCGNSDDIYPYTLHIKPALN